MMRIDVRFATDGERDALRLDMVGETSSQRMRFWDGEPEDNKLGRNFSDVFSIPELLQKVYNAGVNGEILLIDDKDVEWEDFWE